MGKLTRGQIFVMACLVILVAFAAMVFKGTSDRIPTSLPVVEFKPVSCIDAGGLYRCHDAELHVTCYKRGSDGLSCVPDQWTYRDEDTNDGQ